MKLKFWIFTLFTLLIGIFSFCQQESEKINPERQWPGFRGYFARGVLDNANLPNTWDLEKSTNVKWKIEIPGLGLSCPVIWGNKLFITTAISKSDEGGYKTGIYGDISSVEDDSEHEWKLYCYDKISGEIIWERTAIKAVPLVKRHPKSSHANSTPVTDGKFVVAFFGSEGLYCYDMEGELLWKKDFGKLESVFFAVHSAEWDFASSPILYKGVVVIQCDVLDNSFVAAFDANTGEELWKTERDEYPGWSTPNIYIDQGKPRVVLNGYKHRGAYDFETGEEIWKMSGGGDIPIPTPIIGEDIIYFNSAHGRLRPVYAVKTSARGEISLAENETTNEYIVWSKQKDGAYMHTMLLYGDYLYNCRWNGNVSCYNAKTGEELYSEKLGDTKSFTASPVASDGKIYIADDEGTVYVLQAGDTFKLLATNLLNDICMTAPAITDNIIYFRTQKYLVAISK